MFCCRATQNHLNFSCMWVCSHRPGHVVYWWSCPLSMVSSCRGRMSKVSPKRNPVVQDRNSGSLKFKRHHGWLTWLCRVCVPHKAARQDRTWHVIRKSPIMHVLTNSAVPTPVESECRREKIDKVVDRALYPWVIEKIGDSYCWRLGTLPLYLRQHSHLGCLYYTTRLSRPQQQAPKRCRSKMHSTPTMKWLKPARLIHYKDPVTPKQVEYGMGNNVFSGIFCSK